MAKYTQPFIENYINNYWVRNYDEDIENSDFDIIVVGSDQIWSHIHAKSIGGVVNAFLPTLPNNIQRISYAASFGKDTWEFNSKEEFLSRKGIKNFIGVSVRESSGVDLCQEHLNVRAVQHVDPTMLLTREEYIRNLNIDNTEVSPGNLLVYMIDSSIEKNTIVEYIEKKLSLNKFSVNSKAEDSNLKNISLDNCIQPPVEKWLRGFMDAKFVVTDSFHACVFSILFQKPFIVVGNIERGLTRFQSLLEMFGLTTRLVSSMYDMKRINLQEEMNFSNVNKILQTERKKTIDYFKENLL